LVSHTEKGAALSGETSVSEDHPLIGREKYTNLGSNFDTVTNEEFLEWTVSARTRRFSGETAKPAIWAVFSGIRLPIFYMRKGFAEASRVTLYQAASMERDERSCRCGAPACRRVVLWMSSSSQSAQVAQSTRRENRRLYISPGRRFYRRYYFVGGMCADHDQNG